MIHAKRHPAAQNSRAVEFGEIISQRFKLLRDVVGQSLKAHPIGYSPHSLGMTVEKRLYFSRLSNLFFDQKFEQLAHETKLHSNKHHSPLLDLWHWVILL